MNNHVEDGHASRRSISRRALLKALAAGGGVVTASTLLPGKWSKPGLQVGFLPAHAQTTGLPLTVGPCSLTNTAGSTTVLPTDTLIASADISPPIAGIQLVYTLILTQQGHPQAGTLDTGIIASDQNGQLFAPSFDLSTLSPPIGPGTRIVLGGWTFVNPSQGTGVCEEGVDIN